MESGSMLKAHLYRLTAYNMWANERVADLCNSLKVDDFTQEFEGSFPSIRSTLHHLWDAEYIWYARMHGYSPTEFPSKTRILDRTSALEGLLKSSLDFHNHISSLHGEDITSHIEYTTTGGTAYTNTIAEIVSHTMNHSTYHRGQIILYARLLGVKNVPSTDQILYFRVGES